VGRSYSSDIYRTRLPGDRLDRYGVLCSVDHMLLRNGKMREAIIISAILIVAVWIWIPRKGGKE